MGFEDSVREVAIRAVRAAFQRIGRDRLGSYLDLEGMDNVYSTDYLLPNIPPGGDALDEYISRLGWSQDKITGVVSVPANPDNRIEATVVRENIQLPRKSTAFFSVYLFLLASMGGPCLADRINILELTKIIAHAQAA